MVTSTDDTRNGVGSSPKRDPETSSLPPEIPRPGQEEKVKSPVNKWNYFMQIVAAHFACFNTWGMANSFGVFQERYVIILQMSPSAISWIGSMQLFLLFGIGVIAGRATDAGYYRVTLYMGILLQLMGLFCASVASQYWQLLLSQGATVGIGNGLIFCPAITTVSSYFNRWKTLAVGLASSGAAIGGVVYPAIANEMMLTPGIEWTLRTMAFVMLATYIPSLLFARPAFPGRTSGPLVEWTAFKQVSYSLGVLGFFLNMLGMTFAFFYAGTFAEAKLGVSEKTAVHLNMIINGCGFIGRIVPSLLADWKLGALNTLGGCLVLGSITMYSWQSVSTPASVYTFSVFYGILAGALQSLVSSLGPNLTDDVSMIGTRTGMMLTVVSFAALTGTPIAGSLVGSGSNGYQIAQNFAGSMMMAAALSIMIARVSESGWRLMAKI